MIYGYVDLTYVLFFFGCTSKYPLQMTAYNLVLQHLRRPAAHSANPPLLLGAFWGSLTTCSGSCSSGRF